MEKICGIYKIQNKINNKVYIGQSIDIYERWRHEKITPFNSNNKCYNTKINRAIRKYGLDNFEFAIIEQVEESKLNEREIYWIQYFDSFKNGYNMSLGGETGNVKGEQVGTSVLSENDVIAIRQAYGRGESLTETYQLWKSKISMSGFQKIWYNQSWKHICQEFYQGPRTNIKQKSRQGENNNNAKLTSQDVVNIRTRKLNNEKRIEVFKDYQNIISISSFNRIWYGYGWTNIMPETITPPKQKNLYTEKEVIQIRQYKQEGKTLQEVYKIFGEKGDIETFRNIWNYKSWKNVIPCI